MASGVPNYKIILCGEYGVGKSSIFRRFLNNTFTTDNSKKSTIGLDQCTRSFTFGKTEIKVNAGSSHTCLQFQICLQPPSNPPPSYPRCPSTL